MSKRYGVHKRYKLSVFWVAVLITASLLIVSTGYALWSTRLNISGKVDLSLNRPALNVSIVPIGNGRYTRFLENGDVDTATLDIIESVSDVYENDSLTTTVKVNSATEVDEVKNFGISFDLKNVSSGTITDGKVLNIETSNPGGAVSGAELRLKPGNVASGSTTTVFYSAGVNVNELKGLSYYRYEIRYDENGITKCFYFTVRIVGE